MSVMKMDQVSPDLWTFGLLAEGFPRDICPAEVASIVAERTGTAIKKIAPSDSATAWFLFLQSHDDQKACLQHHRTFSFQHVNEEYKIKLDVPIGSPAQGWMEINEDQQRMDSVASVNMFGSGLDSAYRIDGPHGSHFAHEHDSTQKPDEVCSPDRAHQRDDAHEPESPYKTDVASGQRSDDAGKYFTPVPHGQIKQTFNARAQGYSPYSRAPLHSELDQRYPPGDVSDYLCGPHTLAQEPDYGHGRQYAGYPGNVTNQPQGQQQQYVHQAYGSNPIYPANIKEGTSHGTGDPSFTSKAKDFQFPLDHHHAYSYRKQSAEGNSYQSDFVVLPKPQYYLRVTELPYPITEGEIREFFQDRRHYGGGNVAYIHLDQSTKSAAVYFEDDEAIERVMMKVPLLLKQKKIHVEPVSVENKEETEEAEMKTVEIRGLPSEDSTDLCEMYFCNPRIGGGDIESTQWVEHTKVFYITFKDCEVAKTVVSRGHTLKGNVLEVTLSSPPAEEPQCTVEVRGIDPAKIDLYEMYFSNPNIGGDVIEDYSVSDDNTVLHITFQTPEVAERVVARSHTVKGRKLEVILAPAKVDTPPPSTVMVKGFNPDKDEYFYQLYFENPNKGGGDIEHICLDKDNQAILVTFQDPMVASGIIEREHTVAGRKLQLSLYTEEQKMPKRQMSREPPVEEMGAPPRTVVVVIGQQPILSKDTYQFHFESPKHGGGEVEDCDIDKEKKLVFITFVDSEVAAEVVKKKHVISGHLYEVKLYIPKATYLDKLLFKNVADNTSHSTLLLYLESAAKLDVTEVLYADEVGKVLATFQGEPDLPNVNEFCQKRSLEGRTLTACKVPISDSILVENLNSLTTADTVLLYFEHRKSNGGPVEGVELMSEESKCIVQFKDCEVVDQVLSKQHIIDKNQLVVKRYMECLGLSGGSSDPTAFSVPKPITLDDVDPFKIAFLRQCQDARDGLVHELLTRQAEVKFSGNNLIIECSLKQSNAKARILARTWAGDVQKFTCNYLNMIDVHRREVVQQIWPQVEKIVSSANLPSMKGAIKFPVTEEATFVVVGMKSMAQDLFNEIDRLAKEVEAEVERRNQEVTETNSKLQPYKLRLLIAISFQQEAKKRHKDVTVDINLKKNCIVFHGLFKDVKNAEVDMYDVLQTVKGEKLTDMTEMQRKILDNKEARPVIVQKFKTENIVAVWDIGQKEDVNVYAFSDADLVKAVHILKKGVCEHVCQLNPDSSQLLNTTDWQTLVTSLTKNHQGLLLITLSHDNQQVFITCIDAIMHGVVEQVERFLQENTIYSQTLSFSPSRQEFIHLNWQSKLKDIMDDLRGHKVQIAMKESGEEIYVKGTNEGLMQVKRRLKQLDDQIVCRTQTFHSQDYVTFLKSDCSTDLRMIGHTAHCVLKLKSEASGLQIVQSDEQRGAGPKSGSSGLKIATCAELTTGISLSVVQGDIAQIHVDVIVNAANTKMEHIGGLARHIVEKGGNIIQEQCSQMLKQMGRQLQDGDVLVSSSGGLPCKAVIHAVGPIYNGGRSGEEEILFDTIMRCMETADGKHFSSIAFPAVSTGIYCYPAREATKVIVEAVQSFFSTHKRSPIRKVFFCHFEEDVVQLFSQAVGKAFPSAHISPMPKTVERKKGADFKQLGKQKPSKAAGKATSPQSLKLKASIVKGEIAKQTAHVIVNSTSNGLELQNGAVSSSILKAAGSGLQQECTTKYPNGIKSGNIACTAGHGLHCTEVFHLALCNYSNNTTAPQLLGHAVTKCLTEASKKLYKSIAFPVLGTGNLGYPAPVVAQTMLEAVAQFQANDRSTSLVDIRIVVYPSDTSNLQEFQRVQSSMGDGKAASSLPKGSRHGRMFAETHGDSSVDFATKSDLVGRGGTMSNDAEFDFGNIHFVIKQGDITLEDTEAIVNSTNSQLDLTRGGVAVALKKKCGPSLEDACKKKVTEIQQAGVTMTPSFGLPSKVILHVDVQQSPDDMKDIIKSCLQFAEKSGIQSIALPALGTGIGVQPSESAIALFEAMVDMYTHVHKQGSVREIRVVLYDKRTFSQFVQTVQDKVEQRKSSKHGLFNYVKSGIKSAITGTADMKIKQVESSQRESATVFIYGEKEEHIDEAMRLLETIVKDNYTQQNIHDIPELQQEEEEIIKQVGLIYSVSLEIDKTAHTIICSGQSKKVFACVQEISDFIRNIEYRKAQAETASILANVIEWCYLEVTSKGTEVKPYGLDQNRVIETAFQKKEKTVELKDLAQNVYIIDFDQWQEYLRDDPSDSVSIIRRDKNKDAAFGQLPSEWENHKSEETVKEVPLSSTCQEFQDVQKLFMDTGTNPSSTITSISRVQNPHLYRLFTTKKEHLEKQNPGHQNERKLWHGTSADAIQNINHHGFNRGYCGKNAVAFGQGVYFAVNASYSTSQTYSPPDSSGTRHVYLCRVLSGFPTKGDPSMRVLPPRKGEILFDSASDNPNNPKMFIIFNDTQAYPEYLVRFKLWSDIESYQQLLDLTRA